MLPRTLAKTVLLCGALLPGALASSVLLCPTLVQAEPIGSAEIAERYSHLPPATKQALGSKVGGVSTTSQGAKQLYEHGAIYFRETTGALLVDAKHWPRYKELGAEGSVLGHPKGEPDGYGQSFDGGMLSGAGDHKYVVRGALLTVWEKNKRVAGPLGSPTSDSVLEYTNGFLLSSARQTFEGGTIDYLSVRLLFGQPAWLATPSATTTKVRVQLTGTIGTADSHCEAKLDNAAWMNPQEGVFAGWWPVSFAWCGKAPHKIAPYVYVSWRRRGTALELIEASFGWNELYGDFWEHEQDVEDVRGELVRPNEETTLDIDELLEGYDPHPDDYLLADRMTISQTPIKASDIKF